MFSRLGPPAVTKGGMSRRCSAALAFNWLHWHVLPLSLHQIGIWIHRSCNLLSLFSSCLSLLLPKVSHKQRLFLAIGTYLQRIDVIPTFGTAHSQQAPDLSPARMTGLARQGGSPHGRL